MTTGRALPGPAEPEPMVELPAVRRDDQAITELVNWLADPARTPAGPGDLALAALIALWDDLDDGAPADLAADGTGSRRSVSLPTDVARPGVSLPAEVAEVAAAVSLPAVSLPVAAPAAVDEPVPVDELSAGRSRRAGHRLGSRGVAVAAALAAVVSMGGVAAASVASPGSPLWGLHEALLGPDDSTVAAREARADLDIAQRALAAGDAYTARAALDRATGELAAVDLRHGLSYLRGRLSDLQQRLAVLTAVPLPSAEPVAPPIVLSEPQPVAATPTLGPEQARPVPGATEGSKGGRGGDGHDSGGGKDGRRAPAPRTSAADDSSHETKTKEAETRDSETRDVAPTSTSSGERKSTATPTAARASAGSRD
ncbi:MAG: hypothetical protein NVSMB13_19330 [Mycobacteriales bacterium]